MNNGPMAAPDGRGCRMRGQRSKSPKGASFSWSRAGWTVIMAAVMLGIYVLQERRILTEQQLILVTFLAIPVAAFFLSGRGQDLS